MKSLLVAVFLTAGVAQAQDVSMSAVRDPVQKSYRKMLDGAQLFEERRRLAPDASLRFKLIPRTPDAKLDGLRLSIATDDMVIPLRVSPDRTFAIERDESALRGNAQVEPDRKAGTMTWRAEVRTPGLPPHVRRLGDLRLECEVGMKSGLISNYPKGFWGWLEDLLGSGPEFCHRPKPRYLFFAERPVWSVTLVHGERREVLPVDMLYAGATRDPKWREDKYCDCQALFDRTYFVPLGDASWPDDTRVEITYLDDESPFVVAGTRKADVRAALGEPTVLDFDTGYEMWVYRGQPQELVLLFDPAGVLARTRVRY